MLEINGIKKFSRENGQVWEVSPSYRVDLATLADTLSHTFNKFGAAGEVSIFGRSFALMIAKRF
jgi:hypothetical protein